MWENDTKIIAKLKRLSHPIEVYSKISCTDFLDGIKVPSLFINTEDDPVCKPEFIPLDKLYSNPNIVSLIFKRGGHVEYWHGLKRENFSYILMLEFFKKFGLEI